MTVTRARTGLCLLLALALHAAAHGAELRDTRYGYALTPPAFQDPPEGTSVARMLVSGPADGGFAPNVNVTVQHLKMTREAFVSLSESQFKAAGLTVRSKRDHVVSGKPAVTLDYEGEMNGFQLRFLALAVILPDRVILVTYTTTKSSFAKYEPEFRKSLESFNLLAQP